MFCGLFCCHPAVTRTAYASSYALTAVLQIKLSYSVHRDLNVKANNERGWDWTGSNLLQTPSAPAMHNGYGSGPATPVNPLACTPEDAPTGQNYI